jgi:hypothetical protein
VHDQRRLAFVTPTRRIRGVSDRQRLMDAISTETSRNMLERALIGTLTYSFACSTAAAKLKATDLRRREIGRYAPHHTVPQRGR